jgi:RNA polymerase sigma-70 factor, ECF subfamily
VLDNNQAQALLARISDGDETAFKQLYQACSRLIHLFAVQRVSNPAEAEEVVVDTMVDVWKNPQRFRGDAKFSTWLLSITKNKIIDRYRAQNPSHEDIDKYADTLQADDAAEGSNQLAAVQRRAGVDQCMERLSSDHRECLVLAYYEGLSITEIAELQAVPDNTVKTRLFHARQKIKACLASLLHSEGQAEPSGAM